MYEYEQLIIRYMENLKAQMAARPINLGGVSGPSGGSGGPPGGFIGRLPQGRVAYDLTEAATLSTAISGASLVDNLNHIRYRIHALETGSGILGSGVGITLTVKQDGTTVASGITVLNFVGPTVTAIGNTATITTSGGVVASGGSPVSIQNNGTLVTSSVSNINFSGFTITNVGSSVTVKPIPTSGLVVASGGSFDSNVLGYIERLHNNAVTTYAPTYAGLTTALSGAVYGDSVYINSCVISGYFLVNSGIYVDGRGNSTINGMLEVYKDSKIVNLTIDKQDHNTTDIVYGIRLPLILPDIIWQDNVEIENCKITTRNLNATPGEYACIIVDGASYVKIRNNTLNSYKHGIHVMRNNVENHYIGNYISAAGYGIYTSIAGTCYAEANYVTNGTVFTNNYNRIVGANIDNTNYMYVIDGLDFALRTYNSPYFGILATTTLSAESTYTFPDKSGTVAMLDDIVVSSGTGTGNVNGSGILNRIPKWEGNTTTIGNSSLVDEISGGVITLSGTLTSDRVLGIQDKSGIVALLSDIPVIPPIPSGNVVGSGLDGYLTKWSGNTTVKNSSLFDNIGGNYKVTLSGTMTADRTLVVPNASYPITLGVSGEPMGFPSRGDTTISFVDGTRVFTIAPTGANFVVWHKGLAYYKTTETVTIANTIGTHYIYYALTGGNLVLTESTTAPEESEAADVAGVYWNGVAGLLDEERHGVTMDNSVRDYLHSTRGTSYEGGLTGTFLDATFTVTRGYIWDEDIRHDTGSDQTTCRVIYRNGSTWFWTAAQAKYYYETANILQYDNSGTLTDVSNAHYIVSWIFDTGLISTPIIAMVGQRQDTTLNACRINNTPENIAFGSLPFTEMRLLYRVIIQRVGTNEQFVEVADYRTAVPTPNNNFIALDHGTLTGLTDPDHPASAIYTSTSGFNGLLSTADDTVQKALDKLDDHNHGSGITNYISKWDTSTTIRNSNLVDNLNGLVTLSGNITAPRTVTIPNKTGTLAMLDDVLPTGSGIISGSGITNYLPKWVSSTSLGNSNFVSDTENTIYGDTVISGGILTVRTRESIGSPYSTGPGAVNSVLRINRAGQWGIVIQGSGQQSDMLFWSPSAPVDERIVQLVHETTGLFKIRSLTDAIVAKDDLFVADTTSGYVGIGKSLPVYRMDIQGDGIASQVHIASTSADSGGYLTSAAADGLLLSGGAAYDGSAWVAKDAEASVIGVSSGKVVMYSDDTLTPGSTFTPSQRATLDSNGNFGIGTIVPSAKLHVNGGYMRVTVSGGPYVDWNNTAAGVDQKFTRIGSSSAGNMTFESVNDAYSIATTNMMIQNDGDVGIGTSTPTARLDVYVIDSATATVSEIARIEHDSTGTPAAGFGARFQAYLESSTTARQIAGAIDWVWNIATHSTRTAYTVLRQSVSAVLMQKMLYVSEKSLADNTPTALFELVAGNGSGAAANGQFVWIGTNGTDFISIAETYNFSIVNKAGTITSDISSAGAGGIASTSAAIGFNVAWTATDGTGKSTYNLSLDSTGTGTWTWKVHYVLHFAGTAGAGQSVTIL